MVFVDVFCQECQDDILLCILMGRKLKDKCSYKRHIECRQRREDVKTEELRLELCNHRSRDTWNTCRFCAKKQM